MRFVLFTISLICCYTVAIASTARLAGSEPCVNSTSSPSCHPLSPSKADWVVSSNSAHDDDDDDDDDNGKNANKLSNLLRHHGHSNTTSNITSSSSRNSPLLPFQVLGFLAQSVRGGRTGIFLHRRAERAEAGETNETPSRVGGTSTATKTQCMSTNPARENHTITQHEGAAGAHGVAHPPAHGDGGNVHGGSGSHASSSGRNAPHGIFHLMALLARSTRAECHVLTADQLLPKRDGQFHASDSSEPVPPSARATAENTDMAFVRQAIDADATPTQTSTSEARLPRELPAMHADRTGSLDDPHEGGEETARLRHDVEALQHALSALSEEVRRLDASRMPVRSTTREGTFGQLLDFGNGGYWLVGRCLEWKGRFEQVRIFLGVRLVRSVLDRANVVPSR